MTRPLSLLLAAAAALLLGVGGTGVVGAQEPIVWTQADVEMAVSRAPAVVACITWFESSNQPYAVGAAGEMGPIQLLPSWLGGGEWAEYHYGAWTDLQPAWRSANDPFLTTAFLTWWGENHQWTFRPWSAWRVWCR